MNAIALFNPISSGALLKQTAKELGYKVIGVFTQSVKSIEEIYHVTDSKILFQHCDEIIIEENEEEIFRQLQQLPYLIKACIAGTEGGVEIASQMAHRFHLFGNSPSTANATRNKGEMRKKLKASGLSCPGFAICSSEQQAIHFAKTHSYPLMIKAPDGVGSSQIFECHNIDDVIHGFRSVYGKPNFYGSICHTCVIEEYIAGPEYAIDTFSDGKSVHPTDIWLCEKITFGSYRNIYYNMILLPPDDPTLQPIIDYAVQIAKLFGVQRGVAHIEVKNDPRRGVTLIELGSRMAGVLVPELVKKYSNFDPYRATIEVFVKGQTAVPTPIHYKKYPQIAFFPQFETGIVKRISGLEAIEKLPSYDFHRINIKEGDLILPTSHLGEIPLLCYFSNSDRTSVSKDAARAHELFHIEVQKEPNIRHLA